MNRFLSVPLAVALLLPFVARSLTLEELQDDPGLTPGRFARRLAHFEFEDANRIQDPEAYLSRQKGNCADYAITADQVLRAKGYHTRLIYVHLSGASAHSVCYVDEEKGYLDVNKRNCLFRIQHCGPTLSGIAAAVARSMDDRWSFAGEYKYVEGHQIFVANAANPKQNRSR